MPGLQDCRGAKETRATRVQGQLDVFFSADHLCWSVIFIIKPSDWLVTAGHIEPCPHLPRDVLARRRRTHTHKKPQPHTTKIHRLSMHAWHYRYFSSDDKKLKLVRGFYIVFGIRHIGIRSACVILCLMIWWSHQVVWQHGKVPRIYLNTNHLQIQMVEYLMNPFNIGSLE